MKNETVHIFAQAMRERRRALGITQKELAERISYSEKAVSKWESGAADPRMGAVQRIADHFHISKSTILDELDQQDDLAQVLERAFIDRPDMRILFDTASKMDPEDVEKFIRMMEVYKNE